MHRSCRRSGVAAALLLGQAAATAAIAPEAAQDLMKKSGLWGQLDSLAGQVRGFMSSAVPDGDANVAATKTHMPACADTADAMRATAVDAVAGALQPSDVAPLMAWYDSPLGRRVAGMEEASTAQVIDPQERLRRGSAALAYAFACANLGDDDVRRYADHLAAPAAKACNDAGVRGVARALTDGSVNVGRCMKDASARP